MEFMKLSEVPVVEKASDAYILVEEGGEIKRLHVQDLEAPQVQADLSEEDPTKPSYVHGKEDFSGGGGGAGIITYTVNSGLWYNTDSGSARVTAEKALDDWDSGSLIRLDFGDILRNVLSVEYQNNSGSITTQLYYCIGSAIYYENCY